MTYKKAVKSPEWVFDGFFRQPDDTAISYLHPALKKSSSPACIFFVFVI